MQSHKITTVQALFLIVTLEVITASTVVNYNPWGFFSNRQARAIDGVDLHSGEHCVDVSTYGPVAFKNVTVQVCDSTFPKTCEDKTDQVCLEVTEMNCDVEAYTDCTMSMEEVPYKSYDMVMGTYNSKTCTESTEIVQHTKTAPDCRNVTRQNCITKWEIDSNGKKVWAGNEDCEDVTWQECKLVERTVDFTVPKVDCLDDGNPIPYMRFADTNKTQMLNKMTCEVKSAQSCKPVTSTKCASITYQECSQAAVEKCIDRDGNEPGQERQHKQKCILTDGSVPRQGPVVDPIDMVEVDPVAQTTARPDDSASINDVSASSNGFRRGARNFIPSPSQHLTPPAQFAL